MIWCGRSAKLPVRDRDAYFVLGVRPEASDDEIKLYYKKQALLVHPDKVRFIEKRIRVSSCLRLLFSGWCRELCDSRGSRSGYKTSLH